MVAPVVDDADAVGDVADLLPAVPAQGRGDLEELLGDVLVDVWREPSDRLLEHRARPEPAARPLEPSGIAR